MCVISKKVSINTLYFIIQLTCIVISIRSHLMQTHIRRLNIKFLINHLNILEQCYPRQYAIYWFAVLRNAVLIQLNRRSYSLHCRRVTSMIFQKHLDRTLRMLTLSSLLYQNIDLCTRIHGKNSIFAESGFDQCQVYFVSHFRQGFSVGPASLID